MIYKGVPKKGDERREYVDRHRAAKQAAQDSLVKSKIPKPYEEMVKKYFDYRLPEEDK